MQTEPSPGTSRTRARVRIVLVAAACATGAALVIHIVTGFSLGLGVLVLVLGAIGMVALVLRRLPPEQRAAMLNRIRIGALAGPLATVCYDAARYGTVSLFSLSFKPFHVFQLFGEGFLGVGAPPAAAFAVGALYHLANGTGFAIAYTLLVRRPALWSGILWAGFLELSMIALYPSWLQLTALGEFLDVSVVGHAVYGIVLALTTRRLLRPA